MAEAYVAERVKVDPYALAGKAYKMLRSIGWEVADAASTVDWVLAKGRTLAQKRGALEDWLQGGFSPAQLNMIGNEAAHPGGEPGRAASS